MTDWVLRKEFGFEGVVMTDWLVGGMNLRDAVYPAAKASRIVASGGELVMPGGKDEYEDLMAALKAGRLTRKQLLINATKLVGLIRSMKEDDCFL